MRKQFSFLLLAAALLVSVPSWARMYPDGTERNLGYYNLPEITTFSTSNSFGTICVPERIVATQGIKIYDILCVDKLYNGGKNDGDSPATEVARLVLEEHTVCYGYGQTYYDGHQWYETSDEPFCPEDQGTGANPCSDGKVYIDWAYNYDEETQYDYRMKAGGAYFYTACGDTKLADRKIYVDTEDVATAPVRVNGFWGTFEQTTINTPVTVLTQDVENKQYLEQVTKVTMPAHRGYFKGNFECVPWRWNTHPIEPEPHSGINNDIHYPCSDAPKVPRRVSSNAIAFNVGRDAATGLYQVDFEHPIYLGKETNKRIENGQLILEAADGTKYNAFGQRVQ